MSSKSKPKVQVTLDARRKMALMRYPADSFSLIPLHMPKDKMQRHGRIVEVGKAPVHANWTTREYNSAKVRKAALDSGRNVGVRLTDEQLVVDIDPRNGGVEGWLKACSDIGIDDSTFPKVITGSGGVHLYMSKPADVLIRDTLESDDYNGVEFKSKGRQVVAAGSIHPNGKPYLWDEDAPSIRDGLPPVPRALLKVIKRPPRGESRGGGDTSPEQLATKLTALSAEDFSDHDKWLSIMMASHHATAGEGRAEFVDWSTSDRKYAKDAFFIGKRWDSLHADKAGAVTGATLDWLISKHGDPSKMKARDDAADDFEEDADVTESKFPEFESTDADEMDFDTPADDDDEKWQALIEKAGEHGYKTMPMFYDQMKADAMLDHADKSFTKGDAPLFQMGGRIVHPVRTEKASEIDELIRRPANALTISTVNDVRLQMYMIQHVPFYQAIKPPNAQKVLKLFPAPMKLAGQYIARVDKRGLRPLTGIIETPTLRRDGSLLQKPGYDKQSGLLLEFNGLAFKKILDAPTREQALNALAFLKTPFKDFPFVPDNKFGEFDGDTEARSASRSVMLAAMLTAVIRRSLPTAPAFGVTAPKPGTGKTLAIQCVSMMATGRKATATNQGANEEENEKRWGSILLDGDPVTLIDNCVQPVGGASICAITTTEYWGGRTLGKTESFKVATNTTIFYNGNSLKFMEDMCRRALLCRMDARIEKPEFRKFDVNLEEWVPQNRVKLIRAALIVLRAFIHAGRPGLDGFDRLANFELWSDLVRGSLIWLGEPDPVSTQQFIQRKDPVKSALAAVLAACKHTFGDGWFTATDVYNRAGGGDAGTEQSAELAAAIESAIARPTRNSIGMYLANNEDNIVEGLQIQSKEDKKNKTNRYRVIHGGGD